MAFRLFGAYAVSLSIRPLGNKSSEVLVKNWNLSLKKMRLKVSSAKWWAFCLGEDVVNKVWGFVIYCIYLIFLLVYVYGISRETCMHNTRISQQSNTCYQNQDNSKINEVFHGLHHIINVMNGKIALYNHNTTQRCLYRMSKHAPRGISRGLPDPQGILSYQIKKTRVLGDSPGGAIMQLFFCVSVSWNINLIRTQHLLIKVTNTNLVVELISDQNWKDQLLPIHQYMTHDGAFFLWEALCSFGIYITRRDLLERTVYSSC